MTEHAVMVIIEQFQKKYLGNQTLMGFAVLDEDQEILVASALDQTYGVMMTNPIRRWIIYRTISGFLAKEMNQEDDFKEFVDQQCRQIAA
jgi:hypothetical protein